MTSQPERISMPALRARLGVSADTVFRWTHRGLGGVILKTAWYGGRRYSTAAWIEEFLTQVNEARSQRKEPAHVAR